MTNRAAILMYHRVATLSDHGLCVKPDDFHQQMVYLKNGGVRVVPLDQLTRDLKVGTLHHRTLAITFDDGYADALNLAVPIMRAFEFPATFFIVGEALFPGRDYWWDALAELFLAGHSLPPRLSLELPSGRLDTATGTHGERRISHDRLTSLFYELDLDARCRTLERLVEWSRIPWSDGCTPRTMDERQVVALTQQAGMAIGAHTEHHLMLPTLSTADKRVEIEQNKKRLEQLTGREVSSFAYPYGGHDESSRWFVEAAGFETAVTSNEGAVTTASDPLLLPRCDARPNYIPGVLRDLLETAP